MDDAGRRYGLAATFACLMMLAAMGAGGGYMASRQNTERARLYATEGVTATGTVTSRAIEEMHGQPQFWDLDVTYASPDGVSRKGSFRVPQYVWAMHEQGASIGVTYIRSQPALFYVEGAPPELANQEIPAQISVWSTIAAAFLGFGFLVSLVVALRSGASPTSRRAAPQVAPVTIGPRRFGGG
jgi:hypothetical protein